MTKRQIAAEVGSQPVHQNLLVFRLGKQIYAFPLEPVVQVILMVTIKPIPQFAGVIEGGIIVHGVFTPLVSLRRHFGMPQVLKTLHTPIVLLHVNEYVVGLAVDAVVDVLSLAREHIARPRDVLPKELGDAPALMGLAYILGDIVPVLDPDRLFSPNQIEALVRAIEFVGDLTADGSQTPSPSNATASGVGERACVETPQKSHLDEPAPEV